ncbi:MAG: beta-Ala-His dipeptidase [Candidatus Thorarchaeota archaeon]|nr:beta-Ala-His dipeptidase [Candidatus Thorarchaeota archaeon]
MVLEHLEPRHVWRIFERVLVATPRESKKEEKVRAAVLEWLSSEVASRGVRLKTTVDSTGNLLISVPATRGMESCPTVMLQGHLDMVCETNRPHGFDFQNLPIPVRIQDNGEWVDADGTTLGADNGIGVALALGLLVDDDPGLAHGPLEILLTVDEETGLTGAFGLDVKAMSLQSKYLINIDSEELGLLTIGSAGGGDIQLDREVSQHPPPKDYAFYALSVSGLLGGHSGMEIVNPRANANKLVARMLSSLIRDVPIMLSSWHGGSKHNAIPRDSVAVFCVRKRDTGRMEEILKAERDAILSYYRSMVKNAMVLEPEMVVEWKQASPSTCMSTEESAIIVRTANALPHGYRNFSPEVAGLVETSCNFAIVRSEDRRVSLRLSVRSSVDSELSAYRYSIADMAELAGWSVEMSPAYPGWKPEPNSPFLQFVRKHYEEVLGSEVRMEAIHAGLECGIIGAKMPGIQMVSLGPTAKNAHTPDERLRIADVGIVYRVLKAVLRDLPRLES